VPSPEPCPGELVDFAERLADEARRVIRPCFRGGIAIEDKPDETPVTRADREAEAALRALIAGHYPDHGVIGEEHGTERGEAALVWVLDPIDGTKRFITGNPLFGTLIALLRDGRPCLGVIDMPMLGERWVGAAGRPTRFREAGGEARAVATRACEALGRAMLSATSPQMFSAAELPAFERLRRAVKTPLYGGDCYNYALLASGFSDLVVEAGMAVYDFMALVAVVEGAGGTITDWSGRPLGPGSDGRVLAAGDARLHEAALALLTLD